MKTLILIEMTALAGGSVLTLHYRGQSWLDVWSGSGLRRLIAVLILLTLLLSADEVGLGGPAAMFGGLVVLGYVLGALGTLGPAVQAAERELFA